MKTALFGVAAAAVIAASPAWAGMPVDGYIVETPAGVVVDDGEGYGGPESYSVIIPDDGDDVADEDVGDEPVFIEPPEPDGDAD